MEIRSEVLIFAQEMEKVLREHDPYKRGGWDDLDKHYALDKLKEEVQEVFDATSPEEIRREIVDVANICTMIWFNSRRDFWF